VKPPAVPGVPVEDKYLRLPIIWGPSYATGFAVTGKIGRATYAAEVKNASLSSRPSVWSANERRWDHPTISGRVGYVPNEMWSFGASASSGSYLREQAEPTLAPGYRLGDYQQIVFAQDLSFAWHHWQFWAEVFEARFEIPQVGNADTAAYYLETKYKLTPQLFVAARWNEQLFARFPNRASSVSRWGMNTQRFDLALGYRFSPHTQLKVQYSAQNDAEGQPGISHVLSTQLMMRF